MGKTWRVALNGVAVAASATLIAGLGAIPARAEPASPAAGIWTDRSAYAGVQTIHFSLRGATGLPVVDDPAEAAAAGLARIDLLADGELIGTASGDVWTVTWDIRPRPDGPVQLTARSYGTDGRLTHQERIDRWVDHTPPTLRVSHNGFVRAGGEVSVESRDRFGITRVELLSGDRVVATVQLRAYDRAGNLKTTAKRTYRR